MRLKPSVLALALAALAAGPMAAATVSQRARIIGGSGDGQCTVKVDVDDVAEIEVRGDMGYIRNLSGQPGRWVMLECTQAIPRNPIDFRFRGVDGRGRVELIRDPRNSGGSAVVRIQDTKGGREEYHFKLEWRGGDSNWGGSNNRGNNDSGNWGGNSGKRIDNNNRGNIGSGNSWNDEVNFSGRGNGTIARSGEPPRRIRTCVVTISRQGRVSAEFNADNFGRVNFTGTLTSSSNYNITADMRGGDNSAIRGVMNITIDGSRRVTRVSMDGVTVGRERDRLRVEWQN
jgi:hypothetical protein